MFDHWDTLSHEPVLSGHRALFHLRALSVTPFQPKASRHTRREKTRDYRRHGYRRQERLND